jgi:glucose-6-phosphate isomerase
LTRQLNSTEDRPVLHPALRAPRDEKIVADGKNVVPDVHEVLDRIKSFSETVRSGKWVSKYITWNPNEKIVYAIPHTSQS